MRRLAIVCALILAAGVALWANRQAILMRVPGIIGRIIDPVGPNHPVTWQPGPAEAPAGPRPPNILVIVADDLGYNDLTWNGGGVANGAVPTPNIDAIAAAGVQFTHGYTGNATCAPSRAAIMTGRYPQRFGFEFTPAPKAFMRLVAYMRRDEPRPPIYFADREADVPSMEQEGIPASEVTIAQLLRDHGYRTLGFGKWHLGEAPAMQPTARGFDEYLGFLSGASMYLDKDDPNAVNSVQDFDPIDQFLWANLAFAVRKDSGPRFAPNEYMTDYLAHEAARAIEANRSRPFFVYLAFNAPHTPLQALRSDYEALSGIENHTLRVYAAMIRALDRGVGTVLGALKANGLEENTLVIFTSDNGGADYIGLPDINKPFRGWKMTFFEGGVHAPFFARWPARLAPGQRYDAPVAHVDIFATAAGAAGAPLPADRTIDGVDLVKLARGEAEGRPHHAVFWRSGHYRTILADGWKLQVSERPAKTWLFDLDSDPTEQRDLSAERTDKLSELSALLAEQDAQMVKPAWPALIEGAIAIDHPLNVAPKDSDEYVYWAN
ncbi:MAG: sulfatase [Deltaproteobacteria bacterium]|nr:MAG: sulfatase [Deltaproteobacteria bacterium]